MRCFVHGKQRLRRCKKDMDKETAIETKTETHGQRDMGETQADKERH